MTEDLSLRPSTFEEYAGQETFKEQLKVYIQAAHIRSQPVDHVLLAGVSGVGKTTVAHIIGNMMKKQVVTIAGPKLVKADQLTQLLTLRTGDILFIDEMHGIGTNVQDALLIALEDFKINLKDPKTKNLVSIPTARFTCIGATTELGRLPRPLRERFPIIGHLQFLGVPDLAAIVTRSAKKLGVEVTPGGAIEIARRSRGTPRVANNLLKRLIDFALVAQKPIDETFATATFEILGVDVNGLGAADRKYLKVLARQFDGGPVGTNTLAGALDEATETLLTIREPYLLKKGLIMRTPKGRELTKKAYTYLQELKNDHIKSMDASNGREDNVIETLTPQDAL